jgi:RNA polymerase sigma factor (sigma-70 family)
MSQSPVNVADVPDGELLRRYMAGQDRPALEALVRRHGGAVLGVCRRVLGDLHDAEDAFQATFLVFVRKAGSIRPGALVGPWLYGVATRTALKARALAARRRAREKPVDSLPDVAAPAEPEAADWLPLLDREVAGLPAKYRLPVLLCELNGVSRTDAARQLGVHEGTLSSRLARARKLLRTRLSRRGGGAAVLAAAVLFPMAAQAAVPQVLVESTVRAATAFAAGTALATPPAILAVAVLATLRRAKLGIAVIAVAMLVLLGGLGLLITRAAYPAAVVDTRTDLEKLQGDWAATDVKFDGNEVAADTMSNLQFRGDEVNWPADSQCKLEATAERKQIDLTCHLLGPPNNFMLGIYEINGDELKLCFGPPGGDRATSFEAPKGSGRTLMTLKHRPADK